MLPLNVHVQTCDKKLEGLGIPLLLVQVIVVSVPAELVRMVALPPLPEEEICVATPCILSVGEDCTVGVLLFVNGAVCEICKI